MLSSLNFCSHKTDQLKIQNNIVTAGVSRARPPQHSGHLGPQKSLQWAVLCIAGR